MATTISPNMNLIVPVVSNEFGPTWASDINASMSIIDQHNHSSGSGVQITQDGLSLSAAATTFDSLSFNGSNAYALRSSKYTAQVAPLALATDIRCTYVSGVDLYYNDGSGNQVRITSGGSVAGSTGTITGLPSGTASAAYSAGTFVFQSATATAANIDGGSFILRNATASSKGLTLAPPNAMGANYGLVLPALPGATSIMQLDASGNMSATLVVDNSSLEISSNTLRVKAGGITQAMLNSASLTRPTIQTFTSGSGTYTTPAGVTYINVRLVGGGGGGQANNAIGATAGGNTTFSTATAGGGGVSSTSYLPGVGGTASLGAGPIGIACNGNPGGQAIPVALYPGGQGGASHFGGPGLGGGLAGANGTTAATNSGSGGGGGAGSSVGNTSGGGGGGSGGYVDMIINSPAATYSYAVGAAGNGVTNNTIGAPGAAGQIIVLEYYQ